MAMSCNCMGGPNCCKNVRLQIRYSHRTEPMPPIPLEWWRQVQHEGYYEIPTYTNWWPVKQDDDKPKPADDDMRC